MTMRLTRARRRGKKGRAMGRLAGTRWIGGK
jgi:hypothetical protein